MECWELVLQIPGLGEEQPWRRMSSAGGVEGRSQEVVSGLPKETCGLGSGTESGAGLRWRKVRPERCLLDLAMWSSWRSKPGKQGYTYHVSGKNEGSRG